MKIPIDHILISWINGVGVVYEEGPKSEETIKRNQKKAEKAEMDNDVQYQMEKAVEEIMIRQAMFKENVIREYGYDNYTNEFEYELETDSEEE